MQQVEFTINGFSPSGREYKEIPWRGYRTSVSALYVCRQPGWSYDDAGKLLPRPTTWEIMHESGYYVLDYIRTRKLALAMVQELAGLDWTVGTAVQGQSGFKEAMAAAKRLRDTG